MAPQITLRAHQESGAAWLAERARRYLGDRPGVGKTYTLLRALQLVGAKKPMILAPAIGRTHWKRASAQMGVEPRIFSHDEVALGKLEGEELPDALVIDEAHAYRTPSAKRTKYLLGKAGLARRVAHVWPASGTPMWKHPGNLWTIIASLFPEEAHRIGIRTSREWEQRFTTGYLHPKWGWRTTGVRNADQLREVLSRIMIQRTLDDVGEDVPPIDWQLLPIDGPYPRYLSDKDRDPDGGIDLDERDPELATMRRELGEIKAPIISELLRGEMEESEDKIVVFAHHRGVLGYLADALGRFGVSYVDGDTSDYQRAEAVEQFQTDPNQRVFLGQTHACKEVITLTAASRAIQVEPDWTANVNVQAAHRLRRIGQKRHVAFQMVSLEGTLDQRIVRQNLRETRMEAEVFNVQEQ